MIGAVLGVLTLMLGVSLWRALHSGVPATSPPELSADPPEALAIRAAQALASRNELEVPEARCRVVWSYELEAWALIPKDTGAVRLASSLDGVELLLADRIRAARDRSSPPCASWSPRGGR